MTQYIEGPPGEQGPQGVPGLQGPPGPQGPKGDTGSQPPVSDSINSPDSGIAASSLAIKTLYDMVTLSLDRIPSGFIGMWNGPSTSVPEGWLLCDGANGTPDLRDRFILGAGATYADGDAGGDTRHGHMGTSANAVATGTLTENAAAGVVSATTLTTNQIASHSHSATLAASITLAGGEAVGWQYGASPSSGSTSAAGGGQSHTHGFTGSLHTHSFIGGEHAHAVDISEAVDILPPYYALCFIMKI